MSQVADAALRGYTLTNVYGRLDERTREDILGMWLAAGVVGEAEGRRRVQEVVLAARTPAGEVAGVNSVFVASVPGTRGPYYFYRTFIRPADRGVWGLPRTMLRTTVEFLRTHPHPQKPFGLVAVIENRKFRRRAASGYLRELGMHALGRDVHDRDVWCINFDGAVPRAPPGLLRPPASEGR